MSENDSIAPSQYGGLGALNKFQVILKNVDSTISIDITHNIIDFSIYEDIFSPTLYGDVTIKDATNLLNGAVQLGNNDGFPIVGEEYIEVSYSILGQTPIFRRFAVYSIKNIEFDKNLSVRNYILQFCSEEQLLDAITLVQKSYISPISLMAKDILDNYLKVNAISKNGKRKKKYRIQPTKGQQQIVVPRLSPIETLNFLAKRSIAEKDFTSGTYLFFENKNGFNFCDIEYLIQAGRQQRTANVETYTYKYQNVTAGENSKTNAYKSLMNMKQLHKFDTIEKLKRGYFESEAIVYNLVDRSLSTSTYKFLDNYTKSNALGNPSVGTNLVYPENSLDFIRTVTQDPSKQVKKFGIFNTEVESPGKHTKTFFIPQNVPDSKNSLDTHLGDIYTNRAAYMTRLAQNMYTADVYGDTSIGAGDLICIQIPDIVGTTLKESEDKFMSGYFLITTIHHKFTPHSYLCTYDLFKNGFSAPVISTITDDTPMPANFNSGSAIKLDAITNNDIKSEIMSND